MVMVDINRRNDMSGVNDSRLINHDKPSGGVLGTNRTKALKKKRFLFLCNVRVVTFSRCFEHKLRATATPNTRKVHLTQRRCTLLSQMYGMY